MWTVECREKLQENEEGGRLIDILRGQRARGKIKRARNFEEYTWTHNGGFLKGIGASFGKPLDE